MRDSGTTQDVRSYKDANVALEDIMVSLIEKEGLGKDI